MAAESDDLPEAVMKEVHTFADVNVAWLGKVLSAAAVSVPQEADGVLAPSSPPSPALNSLAGAARISRCMTR
jgi:hypothetical protein